MLTVAVVDDEAFERSNLSQMVTRFGGQNALEFEVSEYADGKAFLESGAVEDIVLMDIEMGDVDGMRVAHTLRDAGVTSEIIFVTNMAQYAINGYEVGALDFVLKPVRYPAFAFKLRRAVELVQRKRHARVSIASRSGMRIVGTSDILFVEIRGHKLIYHTEHGAIEAWGTIREVKDQLAPYGFSLCNSCYLVNLEKVTMLEGESVYVGKDALKISRGRRKEFVNALTRSAGA